MTDTNECFPDPADMSDEEKISLIEQLHTAHHEGMETNNDLINAIAGLAWSMKLMADAAREDNTYSKRKQALSLLILKLDMLSQFTFQSVGVTSKELAEAEAFGSIVEDLANDPTLQFPEGED
jgi:hypothetical protein